MKNDDPFYFPYESSRSTNRFLSNHWVIYSCTSLTDAYQKSLYISLPFVFFSVKSRFCCEFWWITLRRSFCWRSQPPHASVGSLTGWALHIQPASDTEGSSCGALKARDQWVGTNLWRLLSHLTLRMCPLKTVGQVEELCRLGLFASHSSPAITELHRGGRHMVRHGCLLVTLGAFRLEIGFKERFKYRFLKFMVTTLLIFRGKLLAQWFLG